MKSKLCSAIPLAEINKKSVNDKTGPYGQLSNLHMWWGRSPLSSTVSILQMILDEAMTSGVTTRPELFDPFSGFGISALAAGTLGLKAVVSDLNPVSVMISKAVAQVPGMFKDCPGVNPERKHIAYHGTKGIAEDLIYYGTSLFQKVAEQLQPNYPPLNDKLVSAWLWVRTVTCPNPVCGCQMPLSSSYVLDSKNGQEAWTEPVIEGKKLRFVLHHGSCPKGKETNKQGASGAQFQCPVCGEVTTAEYIKQMGRSHKLGACMTAVVQDGKSGRMYYEPSAKQLAAAEVDIPENIPAGAIPKNSHWFSPPGFGMNDFSDLFSARQLKMLCTFSDLISDVRKQCISDALSAGFSEDRRSLAEGGNGAVAYGDAVSVYLAFAIDRMADYHSTICSWRKAGGNIRSTFGRQAIPMVWNYAEGNPFSDISGNYIGILRSLADTVEKLPCGIPAAVEQGNALTITFPSDTLVCTELPYYRNIGYADLSDYFYIWMRRSLKDVFPALFQTMVTPKEELSTVCQYYGVSAEEATAAYENQLKIICEKLYDCQTESFPGLIFYEIHKGDIAALQMNADRNGKHTPWETIITGLMQAGFSISAVWPIRAEKYSEKADATRVLIVCEKKERVRQATRRSFVNSLKNDLPAMLQGAYSLGVDDYDLEIVGLGCGLRYFSDYKKILNADGTDMGVHDALQLIYTEVINYIDSQAESVSPVDLSEEVHHAGEF